jgi:uncharacterized protein (TIGR03085 family)
MTETIDERERRELCDLVSELGPNAPTLCEGWTTLDLTAHLVLREHFKRWGTERLAKEKALGLAALLDRLRRGAPAFPWRVPYLRTVMNGTEYFIHHEDVRRANGLEPRRNRPDLEAMASRMVGLSGRVLARKLRPRGLELVCPDGRLRLYGRRGGGAVITGEATEVLLYLSGRREAARVSLTGDEASLAALAATHPYSG